MKVLFIFGGVLFLFVILSFLATTNVLKGQGNSASVAEQLTDIQNKLSTLQITDNINAINKQLDEISKALRNGNNNAQIKDSNTIKNSNNKDDGTGLDALLDKQYALKRAAHVAQSKATQSFRDRSVAMEDAHLQSLNSWVSQSAVMWWMYENTYQCTVDHRMGLNGDGGKWICNPDVIASKPCVLYSFGVRDDFSFETEANTRLGCIGRLYDPTINVDPVQQQLNKFKDIKIDKVGAATTDDKSDYKRLSTLMEKNGHEYIDILKIDIEGSEKEVFREFFETHNAKMKKIHPEAKPADYPIATMILVELHYGNHEPWFANKNADMSLLKSWFSFFKLLEDQGYAIYHKEMNLYDGGAAEYAFVHLDTMEKLEREFYHKNV